MGYYTYYDFTHNRQEIVDKIHEVSGYGEPGETGTYDSVKWYDHIDHMKKVSLSFPDTLLYLDGEGEESGDIWKGYFMNGKASIIKAELSFPDFDEHTLK